MLFRFFTPLLACSFFLVFVAGKPTAATPRYSLATAVTQSDESEAVSGERVSFDFSPRPDLSFQVRVPAERQGEIGAVVNQLMATHLHIEKVLGRVSLDLNVSLLSSSVFYQQTGAPDWVNAMYFKRTIFIPVSDAVSIESTQFVRTVRHEYFHAAMDRLTKGSCPGWIEEGFAQLMEGEDNDELTQFYIGWVRANGMLPFKKLQHGFTELGADVAPAAYAQSVFAVKTLLSKFGYPAMRSYFAYLSAGVKPKDAFEQAFGIDEFYFQDMLALELRGMYI